MKKNLTSREMEVLKLLCDGLNNREIGDKLYITSYTAKAHVEAILRKLDAKNRTSAAYNAVKLELV